MRVAVAAMAIYLVYLPIALWLGSNYVDPVKPEGQVVVPVLGVSKGPGFSYVYKTVWLTDYADSSEDNMRSPVMLYEDLKPLGPARSYLRDIQQIGLGRFSYTAYENSPASWKFVNLSTSDNSDPRTNGRHYWLVLPSE
jgi:hypothetical protein